MFFSLLAASIDGFVCGFLLSGLGVKIKFKDFLISFSVIITCCVTASILGKYLAYTHLDRYINAIGGFIMIYLAISALYSDNHKIISHSIIHTSLSVAADASLACLYLAMFGYSIITIAFFSAVLHCTLMTIANVSAYRIIKSQYLEYTRYLSSGLFFIMGIIRLL